jgi:flagellar hook-length control protein FliK
LGEAKSSNPYSFASQLSATRATNGGTTGLPSAVEQVILQLHRSVKSGNDQMTIQLQPAELGKINIKLSIASDGNVQGTVVAHNPATLDLLLKDVRSLERALQEAGLRADSGSLQFSLSGQSGNTSGQTAEDSNAGKSSGRDDFSDTTGALSSISTDTTETYYLTPGRVNFKV